MTVSLIFSVCALVVLQLALNGGALYLLNRMQGMKDHVNHEVTQARAESSMAKAQADLSVSMAQNLQVKHFDALRTEIQAMQVRLDAAERTANNAVEQVKNFMQKWAVRLGREAKADKEAQEALEYINAPVITTGHPGNGHESTFGKTAR